ncbi:MAG: hypothetical protein RLZZ206_2947 [Cyanobacteriota bacterium]|jgi:hypothetical protein
MNRDLCKSCIVLGGIALLASAGAAIGAPPAEISTPGSAPANVELKGVGYSADLKGKIVVYKVKLAGGNAWITGAPNSWAIFDVVDGKSVVIKQSTLIVNGWTGYSKWWDHNVIAARACKQTQSGWDDPGKCVIGNGNVVKLPEGESIFDYFFEFKWEENGGVQVGKTAIDPKAKPTDVRSMN